MTGQYEAWAGPTCLFSIPDYSPAVSER